MVKFKNWLNNSSIRKKFIPLQWFVICCVVFISLFSFFSVALVNISAENIINENVRNKESLNEIIRNMYVCRVLGRDILFASDDAVKYEYYKDYIEAFNDLDFKMDTFAQHLSGYQLEEFNRIIEEKNVYKDGMIKSADIWIENGDYDTALHELQAVTPNANIFFGSIDTFLAQEESYMTQALDNNDLLVLIILISGVSINVIFIFAVILFINFFSKSMSSSLITLEKAMSEIADTGNMKIEIPNELYTKDEVGKIADVSNKMKTMLLEYSFTDILTGGLNAKAYYEELNDIFVEEESVKEVWCIISDMNNLKLINDFLGHMEGDNALRNSYHALNEAFNPQGKTFRVGGDEFVSLLTNCSKDELDKLILKVKTYIEKLNKNSEHKYSLAIGYDKFLGKTLSEYNEFFKTVDKKMYDNKIASKQARINARVVENPEEKI